MRAAPLLIALLGLSAAALALAVFGGSAELSVAEIGRALLHPDASPAGVIVWELRLPRALTAFACGGLLASAGVLLQALIRNPLAEPYILGVSGGASVAALGALALGAGFAGVRGAALLGALATIWLVLALSYRRGWDAYRLLLTGVVLSAGFAAVVSVLLIVAPPLTARGMLYWLMGDLSAARNPLWPALALAAVLAFGAARGGALNVFATGENQALALGVAVGRLRLALFFVASLATAAVVSEAGPIGFVGLIVPHGLRLIGATDHRLLVPASALAGGVLLVLADLGARSLVAPQQLPVGAVTALLGVPLLLWLLHRNRPC